MIMTIDMVFTRFDKILEYEYLTNIDPIIFKKSAQKKPPENKQYLIPGT